MGSLGQDRRNNRIILSESFCCGNSQQTSSNYTSFKFENNTNPMPDINRICLSFFFFSLSQSCWLLLVGCLKHILLIHLKLNTGPLLNPAIECGKSLLLMLKLFSCVITYFLVFLQDIFNLQRLKRASLVAAMSVV